MMGAWGLSNVSSNLNIVITEWVTPGLTVHVCTVWSCSDLSQNGSQKLIDLNAWPPGRGERIWKD